MYYLQSRYYNPEWGRFISPDNMLGEVGELQGHNLYAYCGNNRIIRVDPSGHIFTLATGLVGAVAGAVIGGVVAAKTGGDWKTGALIGAAVGGLVGLGVGALAGPALAGKATASIAGVITGGKAVKAGVTAAVSTTISTSQPVAKQVFWAGGQPAQKAADTFAKLTGGTTIANDPIGKQVIAQVKNVPWNQAKPLWKSASLEFAQQASGVVHAFIYAPYFSSSSLFVTVELPALLNNPKVTKVIITLF